MSSRITRQTLSIPSPSLPRRVPLGLCYDLPIPRGRPVEISTTSQLDAFWIDRLLIRNASHWRVLNGHIEGDPWLRETGGEAFSVGARAALPPGSALAGDRIRLKVSYVGPRDEAARKHYAASY